MIQIQQLGKTGFPEGGARIQSQSDSKKDSLGEIVRVRSQLSYMYRLL
jgi:hypothetical protein